MLADDRAGNVSQALGVAEALGWPFEIKQVRYGALAWLPNPLLGASLIGIAAAARVALAPPWPDLVVAAGRRTAPVARWIKREAGGRCFLVQLMWPGTTRGLDLIAVPEHDDPPPRPEILVTLGAAHRVTPEKLEAAAAALAPAIADLPRPRIACLVGGTSRHAPFTAEDAAELGRRASAMAEAAGGALLVTTSRRTGEAIGDTLVAALRAPAFVHRFGDPGDNPYLGMLGAADAVIVTADSASMSSEALATGRMVYLFTPKAGTAPKLARFQARLRERDLVAPLGAPYRAAANPPFNPAREVALAVRERLPATGHGDG